MQATLGRDDMSSRHSFNISSFKTYSSPKSKVSPQWGDKCYRYNHKRAVSEKLFSYYASAVVIYPKAFKAFGYIKRGGCNGLPSWRRTTI